MRATGGKNWEPRTQGRWRISRYNVGYQARDFFFRHFSMSKKCRKIFRRNTAVQFSDGAGNLRWVQSRAGDLLALDQKDNPFVFEANLNFLFDSDDDGGFCSGVGNYNDDESPLQEGQPNPSGFEANFNFLFAETCFLCTNGCFFGRCNIFEPSKYNTKYCKY